MKDYRTIHKYEILIINGKLRLIRPVAERNIVQYYRWINEPFNILHRYNTFCSRLWSNNCMYLKRKNKYFSIFNEPVKVI